MVEIAYGKITTATIKGSEDSSGFNSPSSSLVLDSPSFSQFMREVAESLSEAAVVKGYSAGGPDGPNPLFEVTGSDHAMGEAIYKAVRYRAKRDKGDLIKLAAWAFLAYRFHK